MLPSLELLVKTLLEQVLNEYNQNKTRQWKCEFFT